MPRQARDDRQEVRAEASAPELRDETEDDDPYIACCLGLKLNKTSDLAVNLSEPCSYTRLGQLVRPIGV
ncbi:MAG TPA: hypothetical protein VFM96_14445 [Gaiellaceae bacterium]|nr:hypothetical protein [Gaiellaceae bacterium]